MDDVSSVLVPHAASPVEWWYVEGRLALADGTTRAIMIAVFRGPLRAETPAMAFVAVHEEASRNVHRRSVISPGMIAFMEDAINRVGARELPDVMLRIGKHAFRRIARARAADGLVVAATEATFVPSPFHFEWQGIELREDKTGIALRFEAAGCVYDLTLHPDAPWSDLPRQAIPVNLGIAGYRSCPRVSVSGDANGAALTGSVWFDRQWGDESQIVSVLDERVVLNGWDWFAINLENGVDLMLYQPRNLRSGASMPGFGTLWTSRGWQPLGAEFSATPFAHIRSRTTGHRYPTAWGLDVPEVGIALRINAEANGEIPVYGPMGWNWQSPVNVEGSMNGDAVKGSGWLELNGYGYPLAARAQLRFWTAYLRSLFTHR